MAAGGRGVPEQRSAGAAQLSRLQAQLQSHVPISRDAILTQSGFSLQLPKAKKKRNQTIFFNPLFGKFCSEEPPSVAVLLAFSNLEAA